MKEFMIQTPASSANLGSGFDALGLALNLYNRFYFKLVKVNQPFSFQFKNLSLVSKEYDHSPENNLLVRAYLHTCKIQNFPIHPFEVMCDNKIPDSSGLGSSTTAILAGIAAAFIISGFEINEKIKKQILKIGFHFEKHPDNLTPCLYGGFCIGVMNDAKNDVSLARHKLNHPNLKASIVLPKNIRTSTNQSRTKLTSNVSLDKAIFNLSRTALLASALISGDFSNLKIAMQDGIHQDARLIQSGEKANFDQLFNTLKTNPDFLGISLSGSGPSMLILSSLNLQIKELVNKTYPQHGAYLFDLGFDNQGICFK